jgi:hypothetical protein
MSLKPGDFVSTGFGYGLVLNKYTGDPELFYGNKVAVCDIIYNDALILNFEISKKSTIKVDKKTAKEKEAHYNIIDGIFTKVSMNNLKKVKLDG